MTERFFAAHVETPKGSDVYEGPSKTDFRDPRLVEMAKGMTVAEVIPSAVSGALHETGMQVTSEVHGKTTSIFFQAPEGFAGSVDEVRESVLACLSEEDRTLCSVSVEEDPQTRDSTDSTE